MTSRCASSTQFAFAGIIHDLILYYDVIFEEIGFLRWVSDVTGDKDLILCETYFTCSKFLTLTWETGSNSNFYHDLLPMVKTLNYSNITNMFLKIKKLKKILYLDSDFFSVPDLSI